MAALFLVSTLVGFIPDSLMKIELIKAGQRPPFPPILHVHAVLMGCWLLLLLAQTTLMATGRSGPHKQLGIASMVLAPVIVITGIFLIPTIFGQVWAFAHAPPPGLEAVAKGVLAAVSNIMLVQIRIGFVFAITVWLALRARRGDPGLHKRLMVLATLSPLPAAIDRMTFLPTTLPASPASIDLYLLLWMSPMFLWDLFRLGRVHRAYLVWLGVSLPFAVATHILWGTAWWQETAPRIAGVAL